MPYIDPTGANPGFSEEPQPDLGLTQWVDEIKPSMAAAKSAKHSEIDQSYASATSVLAEGYPAEERESWAVQIMESAVVLNGTTGVDTPWIDAAASARGISRMDLASKIRDMDVQYRQIHGALTGKRQRLHDEIEAALTVEAVQAIQWAD